MTLNGFLFVYLYDSFSTSHTNTMLVNADVSMTPSYCPLFMFDNCEEISSLWHDSSSFNRLVAKVMNAL